VPNKKSGGAVMDNENLEIHEIIGTRVPDAKIADGYLFTAIIGLVLGAAFTVFFLIFFSAWIIVAIALIAFGALMLAITFSRVKNNKCKTPTIVLRNDGVFVIYYENGKIEAVTGKILEVTAHPAQKCKSGGTYGHVTFKLENETTKKTYFKVAGFVKNCEAAAARINEILAARAATLTPDS